MKIRYLIIYLIIFVVAVLIFGLSFNSCTLISETGGSEEEEEASAEPEESAGDKDDDAEGEEETEEKEPESAEGGESDKGEEESELPGDLDKKEEEKDIIVESPKPNEVISSPLVITGEAKGTWFFEANFPVKLLDGNGEEIAIHYAEALDEWMTEDFVPFRAEIEFEKTATDTGFLVLEKNNPSDIREYDDELIISVRFK
jgi:hypothetical protein